MRIGIMMRDIGNQKDAPGIIVLNLVDKILELDKQNNYVLFLPDDIFADRYKSFSNVKCVRVTASSKIIWDQIKIPFFAQREKLDLLFHPKHSIPLLVGCKTVMHLRGDEYWVFPEHFELSDIIYQKLFLPLCCKKATHLIAESLYVANGFQKYLAIPAEKMSLVYLSANERFNKISNNTRLKKCVEEFSLPERFVLTVTRIKQQKKYYPGKNLLRAIDAFQKSKAREIIYFVIAGRNTKEFLQKKLGSSNKLFDRLVVLDFVPQSKLPELYNLAEFFLFPSKYESFGIPIVEAMACGCPVITSNTFACPEIAGNAAYLVNPMDSSAIARGIDMLAFNNHIRKEMAKKSLLRAKDFSWQKAALETIDIFNHVHLSN